MTNIITVVLFGITCLCGPTCLIVSDLLERRRNKQQSMTKL